MNVRGYTSKDYPNLCHWLDARSLSIWKKEHVPQIGYVALADESPIVVGFLRLLEGNSAMLDGLCSNPDASAEKRNEAIDLVVQALLFTARKKWA